MKNPRMLNGYRVIYKPECESAMTTDNWNGYVYEHIFIATKWLKRKLRKNEMVHHLNGNRLDNRKSNLLVILHSEHSKIHQWIESGAPYEKSYGTNRMNSGKSKAEELIYCKNCKVILDCQQKLYCSQECCKYAFRKVERPSKEILKKDMDNNSMLALGRKYGVSDNAVRKWIKQYNLQ